MHLIELDLLSFRFSEFVVLLHRFQQFSELETFFPLSDHAHCWEWGVEGMMIVRCRGSGQATTTSARPPQRRRPHQLCNKKKKIIKIL